RRASIPLVDLRPLLQAECDMNILGDEILVDHVHPSIEGYQKIALRLFQELENMGIVAPQAGWEERRKELFREQLAELDEVYYARGQQHLEGLRLWASGRTNRIRPTAAEGNQGP